MCVQGGGTTYECCMCESDEAVVLWYQLRTHNASVGLFGHLRSVFYMHNAVLPCTCGGWITYAVIL